MLSCAINSKENRYVVVFDIPRAFLNANLDDNVHMLLEGTIAEMISSLDPTIYSKYILYNKQSKPMLYIQLIWPFMGQSKQQYYSGNYYQRQYRSGFSHSTNMKDS